MTVVKMQKITVVGSTECKAAVIHELMDLGLVHIEPLAPSSETPADLAVQFNQCQKTIRELTPRLIAQDRQPQNPPPLSADEVLDKTGQLRQQKTDIDSQLNALQKERTAARPWGNLTAGDIDLLSQHKVCCLVGQLRNEQLPEQRQRLDQEATWWAATALPDGRHQGIFAIFPLGQPPHFSLDDTPLPTRSLTEIDAQWTDLQNRARRCSEQLNDQAMSIQAVRDRQAEITDQITHLEVANGALGDAEIFALTGWCPVAMVDRLAPIKKDRALAILETAPDGTDAPPVQLKNGLFVSFFEPLLKAFDLPSYKEGDPTFLFAPFMALFFGFCLGDVAYGLLLFALATWAGKKYRPQGETKKAVRLMQVLGISATTIGALTGIIFGEKYYAFLGYDPTALLFPLSEDPSDFFYLSLAFGAVQLTFGLCVKLINQLRYQRFQEAIATIGWLSLLPGVAIWATQDTPLVFALGAGLVFLFSSPQKNVVKRLGGGAWALYNISGLFGDVMSYARIFGLGLSTGIIGHVINIIAMAASETPYVGWVFAAIILIIGHTFNFAMAVIGSLVHPARLQFLEFFGKFFEGGGQPYRPLSRVLGGYKQ